MLQSCLNGDTETADRERGDKYLVAGERRTMRQRYRRQRGDRRGERQRGNAERRTV